MSIYYKYPIIESGNNLKKKNVVGFKLGENMVCGGVIFEHRFIFCKLNLLC